MMHRALNTLLTAAALLGLSACSTRSEPSDPAKNAPNESATAGIVATPKAGTGPHLLRFPGGDTEAATFVAQTMKSEPKRRVLVYVGASWCEPCRRFHDAIEAGELDETFPDLELIEFDLDEHRSALTDAGYGSRLVPLFSVPNAQGVDQEIRIEGSIKGEAAVQDNLVPRLEALLARSQP